MDKGLKCKTGNHKNSRRIQRQQNLRHMPKQFFTDTAPRAIETKEKMNKWDYIKIKSFCTAKETINKTTRKPTVWENIFANDII